MFAVFPAGSGNINLQIKNCSDWLQVYLIASRGILSVPIAPWKSMKNSYYNLHLQDRHVLLMDNLVNVLGRNPSFFTHQNLFTGLCEYYCTCGFRGSWVKCDELPQVMSHQLRLKTTSLNMKKIWGLWSWKEVSSPLLISA